MSGITYLMMLDDNGIHWAPIIGEIFPFTTKGDTLGFDGTNVVGVNVGSDTTVQTADSNATAGVTWAIPAMPTAAPASPGAGAMYFDATTNIFYVYNGSAWVQVPLTVPQ